MDKDKEIIVGDSFQIVPDGDDFLHVYDNSGGEIMIIVEEELVPLIDALQAIRVARNIK